MAVNLSPVFGVAAQLFNDNGDPLAGGKIYTYAAGTTTNATTYTSSNGAIAHSNPIILDGAGRVPSGEIWLTDGISYKFVVEDSVGTLIGTYDNLVGINSNFVNYTNEQEIQTATAGQTVFNLTTMQYQPGTNSLSVFVDGVNQYGPGASYAYVETDSDTVTFVSGLHVGASVKFTTSQINASSYGDASQISYTPGGANVVVTNVQDKLRQYVSVFDYMDASEIADVLARTATVDVSTAIQQALIEAATNNGQEVFFPAGLYRVDSTIYCGPSTNIVGEGTWDAVNGTSTYSGTMFTSQVDGIFFFHAVSQNDMPGGVAWPANSNANSGHSFRIENIGIYGKLTDQRGIVIGDTTPVTQVYLQNISIRDCLIGVDMRAAYGVDISGVNVRSNVSLASSKGFQLGTVSSPTSGSITNCFIFSCANGIYISGAAYYPGFCIQNIDIDGCTKGVVVGDGTGNIAGPNLFRNIGFENSIESDFYIRVASGSLGIDGYLIATAGTYTDANINVSSTSAFDLFLSNGQTVGAVAAIKSGANVGVHLLNWENSGTVNTPADKLYTNAEYQTGTWTPALTPASGSVTYASTPTGTWTKMGNMVFVSGVIELATNSGSGALQITALPYTVAATGSFQVVTSNYGRITLSANYYSLGGQFLNSQAKINLFENGSGSTVTNAAVQASQLQGTAYIAFSGTYMAA